MIFVGFRASFAQNDNSTANVKNNVLSISIGETVESEISGGEKNSYSIYLKQGQILRIDLEENGIDLVVILYKAENNEMISRADFGSGFLREVLTGKISTDGDYKVVIEPQQSVKKGKYKILISVRENENLNDIKQIKAERLMSEGFTHINKDTADGAKEAVKLWTEALNIWQELNESYWISYTKNALGAAFYSLGENTKALDFYNAALASNKTAGNDSLEATIVNNIGVVFSDTGERNKALENYFKSLSLKRKIGNKNGEATTLNNIGEILSDTGKKEEALKYFKESLTGKRSLDNKEGEAIVLNNIGGVLSSLGKKQEALECYDQALEINKSIDNKSGQATAIFNIGAVQNTLGEKLKALNLYKQALTLYESVDDKPGISLTKIGLGEIYFSFGERREALKYFDEALQTAASVNYKKALALALNNLGSAHSALEDKKEALKYYSQALELLRSFEDKKGEANALNNIGSVYLDMDDVSRAVDFFAQSLLKSNEIGDRQGQAVTLGNMAYISSIWDEDRNAAQFVSKSLALLRITGDKNGETLLLSNLMFTWNKLGNRRLAIFFGKQSINKSQLLRALVRSSEIDSATQKSFLKTVDDRYRFLAELLIEQGEYDLAIEILNLYQDQQFFDFNFDPSSPVKQIKLNVREQDFAARYEAAVNKIARIVSQIDQIKRQAGEFPEDAQKSSSEQLGNELKTAEAEYLKLFKDAELAFAENRTK